jgi:hypothetical protein
MLDQAERDVALLRRGLSAAFSSVLHHSAGAGVAEHGFIDERVVDDDIGLGERVHRVERQEARIAGPGADEPDPAGLEAGQVLQEVRDGRHGPVVAGERWAWKRVT